MGRGRRWYAFTYNLNLTINFIIFAVSFYMLWKKVRERDSPVYNFSLYLFARYLGFIQWVTVCFATVIVCFTSGFVCFPKESVDFVLSWSISYFSTFIKKKLILYWRLGYHFGSHTRCSLKNIITAQKMP